MRWILPPRIIIGLGAGLHPRTRGSRLGFADDAATARAQVRMATRGTISRASSSRVSVSLESTCMMKYWAPTSTND
jgi:hypothetical protein